MVKDLYTGCAEQLAVSPDLVAQLLHDHVPNADGWCRGHAAHTERHPCPIRRLAELARNYAAERPVVRPHV